MRSTGHSTIRNNRKFSAQVSRFMTGLLLCMLLLPTSAHAALGGTAETVDRHGMYRGPVTAPTTDAARLPARSLWLERTLFNMTASFLGVPGLASPVDGLPDEGLGLHADGTTRRAGGADGASGFGGQRAASYMRSGVTWQTPWLYDDLMGYQRGPDGRLLRPGSEYSGRRGQYGGGGYGQFGSGMGSMGDSFAHSLLQRGISAGMGFANSAVESSILGLMGTGSPYGSGKARLNFNLYIDGQGNSRFGGEGDVLWPLFDNPYTTIYTQFGARSMYGGGDKYGPDRWIGNWGVGQRWFPGAKVGEDGKSVDSGNWMVGYNAFFDYDITRGHQRGGLGVEAQYDWLKLASNWYFPLSDWKDSKDFDGRFVQERAAQGWDLRAKGYLPFYREIAITGSYTQWYGDHVGMFGPSKLEKNPKVWSYGIEYTPVPALTAFVNQRQTERGRADTEFGLRFTYHFGMDAESQFKPSRVAEMRTVHGARHDFVDRENKIILEYRAKNKFHIEYLGFQGNAFVFRIRNGFDKYVAGQTVHVTASGAVLASAPVAPQTFFARAVQALDDLFSVNAAHAGVLSKAYQTDGSGTLRIPVDAGTGPVTLTLQVGDTTQSFTVSGGGGGASTINIVQTIDPSTALWAAGQAKVTVLQADGTPASGVTVNFTTVNKNGGASRQPLTSSNISTLNATQSAVTDSSGEATYNNNGAVPATLTITATLASDSSKTASLDMQFAPALPPGFITGAVYGPSGWNWSTAGSMCSALGGKLPLIKNSTSVASTAVSNGDPVDGFGTVGGAWPSNPGVPSGGGYWTGTDLTVSTGSSWAVGAGGGNVIVDSSGQRNGSRVVCVP